jgi:hypothetical protein
MAPLEIKIIGALNQEVPAIIRRPDLIRDGLSWFVQWFPRMYDLSGEPLFEDSHWKVPDLWERATSDRRLRVLILEAVGQIQGWVVFQLEGYTGIDGRPCVYVAFISTAPWNRDTKGGQKREYKRIGKALLSVTLLHELKATGNFEMELHSLPGAELFYRKIGMRETGRQNKEGLKLFRMEKPQALSLLRPFLPALMRKE